MSPRHEIPTHLGVIERPLWGLSIPQFFTLFAGALVAIGLWNALPMLAFTPRLAVAGAAVALSLVLALVRPGRLSLLVWAVALARYVTTPKRCLWSPLGDPDEREEA